MLVASIIQDSALTDLSVVVVEAVGVSPYTSKNISDKMSGKKIEGMIRV